MAGTEIDYMVNRGMYLDTCLFVCHNNDAERYYSNKEGAHMTQNVGILTMEQRAMIREVGFVHFMSISTFAASMGYCGLCFGWRYAHQLWGLPAAIGETFGFIAICLYILILFQYMRKLTLDFETVRAELHSPTNVAFFGTFTVSTVLLAAVLAPYHHAVASVFWWIAMILILFFGWALLTHWLLKRQRISNVTPAWLLPVLGPITIPVAGNILMNPGYHDISIICVAIGIVTSIPVIALLLVRSIIGKPLADAAQPSLMILMAPFGMGFITYTDTFGFDNFALMFISAGIFLLPPIAIKVASVMMRSPFRMSWWATSFPSMAFTNGILKLSTVYPTWWTHALGVLFLVVSSSLILWLTWKTGQAIIQKRLWMLY